MARYSIQQRLDYDFARIKRELSPCPGRTGAQRKYITRRLREVMQLWSNHFESLPIDGRCATLIPQNGISSRQDTVSLDNREYYESASVDSDRYITEMHNHNQRATNRITVAAWYRTNEVEPREYMTQKILVSPFLCPDWGALPLTLSQWRVLMPEMGYYYMCWSWVHDVRSYMDNELYFPGAVTAWHMEKCKPLPKSVIPLEDRQQWLFARDIYKHVSEKLSNHLQASTELVTPCP